MKKDSKVSHVSKKFHNHLITEELPKDIEEITSSDSESSFTDFNDDRNISVDCFSDTSTIDKETEEILKHLKDSTHIQDEEIQKKLKEYLCQKLNDDDMENILSSFGSKEDAFRHFIMKANDEKFKVMLSESSLFDDVDYFC
jgi:hypothetical protein